MSKEAPLKILKKESQQDAQFYYHLKCVYMPSRLILNKTWVVKYAISTPLTNTDSSIYKLICNQQE